jgi:hypothetical protein
MFMISSFVFRISNFGFRSFSFCGRVAVCPAGGVHYRHPARATPGVRTEEDIQLISYLMVGLVSGVVFGVLDSLINGNPLARRLHEVYKPIGKTTINVPAGVIIDLAYGFVMAGIFLVLYASLPGEIGVVKGITFAVMAWFFRVIMSAVSNWMMFKIPVAALLYSLLAGLAEMLVLGLIYGFFLKPWA